MKTKVLGGFLEGRILDFGFYQMSYKHYFGCFYVLVVANKFTFSLTMCCHYSHSLFLKFPSNHKPQCTFQHLVFLFLSRVSHAILFKAKESVYSLQASIRIEN